ncbi:hypothetical protein AKJ37_04600 [candidate division MSBL1 archaeon SCGC-AAA259I09]|uniref:OB domain-containing protein n=1 Tax=candidate division MSBL1 archaeon SCGC-AAA259I09 TaxID=1698267 RepID=A0A133UR55_9EURY|nr:hypothetical protein AKJ37_04600 [candidate division MSBL1 archaeon SCGC-AAA259I09]
MVGRITDRSEISTFTREDESEGKVGFLTIGDETGTIRVAIWGDRTEVMDRLERGDVIKITESYTVPGNYGGAEIHVGERGKIETNPECEEELPPVSEIPCEHFQQTKARIEEVEEGTRTKIRGTVVKIFERDPVFSACPKCGRSLDEEGETLCEKCGEAVEPEPTAVVSMMVDDGTGSIRVVAFGEIGEELFGKSAEEISRALNDEGKDLHEFYDEPDLLGREVIFSGTVRRDDYFDQLELRARDLSYPDPIEEANELLEKMKE